MKLFGHHDSGHAFKVRLFLKTHDIKHDYEWVDIYSNRESRQAEFIQHARYGEVPLLLHDDKALTQSNAILVYLGNHLNLGWGESESSRHQVVEWLMWEANKIGMCLPQLRSFKREGMDVNQSAARNWLLDRFRHDVNVLEQAFSDGRPWIVNGDAPSLADFSICAYLLMADDAGLELPGKINAWLQRISNLSGFAQPAILMRDTQ